MITFHCTIYFAFTPQLLVLKPAKESKFGIWYLVKKSVQNVFLDFYALKRRISIYCLTKGIKSTTVLSLALIKIICRLK